MIIPFFGSTDTRAERTISSRRMINWYLEPTTSNPQYPFVALRTDGTKVWDNVGTLEDVRQPRFILEHKGVLYFGKSNLDIRKYTDSSDIAAVTTISPFSGTPGGSNIKAATLEDEIIFFNGDKGIHYNLTTGTLTEILQTGFPPTTRSITTLKGYFIAVDPGTNRFYHSDLNDGLTWEDLNVGSANSQADRLIAAFAHRDYLWLFGEYTIEIWQVTGNANTVFAPQISLHMAYGVENPDVLTEAANQLFWIGRPKQGSPVVLTSEGFQPRIISNLAINQFLSNITDFSKVYAFSYAKDGHEFVVFQFPDQKTTHVYDVSINEWHERASTDAKGNQTYWTGEGYAYFGGHHLLTSHLTADVIKLDSNTRTDHADDNTTTRMIRRELVSEHMDFEGKYISASNLKFKFRQGVGLTGTGQGSDPQAMFSYSNDYGFTWNQEMWISPGAQGEYYTETVIPTLGQGRAFTFKLVTTDPCNWVLHGASADIEAEQ